MNARLHSVPLLIALSLLSSAALAVPTALKKAFHWTFDGVPQKLEVDLSGSAYLHYRTKPRSWSYGSYTVESPTHPVIAEFAHGLEEAATLAVDTEWDRVRFALSFVQHIRYADDIGGEYPRFPIETLVDGTGDCEDTAILLAAILDAWGLDCVLLSPPGHMALGLAVSGMDGTYYPHNSKRYFYVETTGKNWGIGDVPPMYAGQAKVIELITVGGPRRVVEYVAPREPINTKLQFAVYRSTTHTGSNEGRVAYQYKIRLEGNEKLMKQVREVRYQRQHLTFAEYRDGNWLVQSNPATHFEATWTAWRNANIAVQVEFNNGQVSEFMIRESAIEAAR